MDKTDLKAREDEIARMVTEFCNGKIDADQAILGSGLFDGTHA